ncbi:MAG: hypothetical protein ABSG86_08910 [Thermoguttaceae bacterium]|jgi:hypothetical protein
MDKDNLRLEAANTAVEDLLNERIRLLELRLKAEVLCFVGAIITGIDGMIRDAVEHRVGSRRKRGPRLAVILETGGGYLEVTQRIVETLRKHYRQVEFIVPNYAMSAGTVLVLSGDAIWMDYYSVLGPIDPQIERGNGQMLPALGYLEQFRRLVEKSQKGNLTSIEAAYLIQRFDPAEMYKFEQARAHSVTLIKQWLVRYKFKDWKRTRTRKRHVTIKMKRDRAEEIASLLNETQTWHSHGHGISLAVLRRKVKLEIKDFGSIRALNTCVQSYYRLLSDYMMRRGQDGVIHVHNRYIPLFLPR